MERAKKAPAESISTPATGRRQTGPKDHLRRAACHIAAERTHMNALEPT